MRYVANYEVDEADVIPLVFETYGGYAKKTMDFLHHIAGTIAGEDDQLRSDIMRHIRDIIAVNLFDGHARVINSINSKNYAHSGETLSRR